MRAFRGFLKSLPAVVVVAIFVAVPAVAAAQNVNAQNLVTSSGASLAATTTTGSIQPSSYGGLDCNGLSTIQHSALAAKACTDIRGFANVTNSNNWNSRFWDNGVYIGHDEPDMTFLSNHAGSGNDATWTETLGADPSGAPTVSTPGSDVSNYFELTIAPWFSMALCDGNSYPLNPCTPNNDANAPACITNCGPGQYTGAGSDFLELQFYPPGFAPFFDSVSCDNTHWCAAVHINSLECTYGFVTCNPACEEPTNFAFVQMNGVPTGPASPQLLNFSSGTPNAETLLMNPGDHIKVHIFDAPVPSPGSGNALEAVVNDLSTGQSGYMQASALNGFAQTSIVDCSGTYFNFEPEYSSAAKTNIVPWAALQVDISTEFEIGHFTPCTSLYNAFVAEFFGPGNVPTFDNFWAGCNGPYEGTAANDSTSTPEGPFGDGFCFPAGDTHGVLAAPPNRVTGCLNDLVVNGDLDFDGSPYWAEWPTSAKATDLFPASFVQSFPTFHGHSYSKFFFQTDVALSESTCLAGDSGCAVPPPNAPGAFYPYWSVVKHEESCQIEFGNVHSGHGVNDFGKDGQYGQDLFATLGYDEFEGPLHQVGSCSGDD